MKTIAWTNAYFVLGLDSTADQAAAVRRGKEIAARMKIGDTPVYPGIDAVWLRPDRDGNSVNEAIRRFSTPKSNIKDQFIWYQIVDDEDQAAVRALATGNCETAIEIWEKKIRGGAADAEIALKNQAVLCTLLLMSDRTQGERQEYLRRAIASWKKVLGSQKNWATFKALYKLRDEWGLDDASFRQAHDEIPADVSDLFALVSKVTGDTGIFGAFQKELAISGGEGEKEMLSAAARDIQSSLERLHDLRFIDGDQDVGGKIVRLYAECGKFDQTLERATKAGIAGHSRFATLRDELAQTIRDKCVSLHNKTGRLDESIRLMGEAIKIGATASLRASLQNDMNVLLENRNVRIAQERQAREAQAARTSGGGSGCLWWIIIGVIVSAIGSCN